MALSWVQGKYVVSLSMDVSASNVLNFLHVSSLLFLLFLSLGTHKITHCLLSTISSAF